MSLKLTRRINLGRRGTRTLGSRLWTQPTSPPAPPPPPLPSLERAKRSFMTFQIIFPRFSIVLHATFIRLSCPKWKSHLLETLFLAWDASAEVDRRSKWSNLLPWQKLYSPQFTLAFISVLIKLRSSAKPHSSDLTLWLKTSFI